MARSKEEWRRRNEEANARPYLFGYTVGQFDALPLSQQRRLRQRFTQYGATFVGLWKDCDLAKCRRAKRCVGYLSEAQLAKGYNESYPPCARGEEEMRAKIYHEGLEALAAIYGGDDDEEDEPKYAGRPSDQIPQSDEPR